MVLSFETNCENSLANRDQESNESNQHSEWYSVHDQCEQKGWEHRSKCLDGEVNIELCVIDAHVLLYFSL